jgi:hypothetical protein
LASNLPAEDKIQDYFDLVAGTSTGGIIAIALGMGVEPHRIRQLYEVDGKKIFPPFWVRNRGMRLAKRLFLPIHNHAALEKALRGELTSLSLGDSSSRLLIPAFVGPSAQVAVFKTDHHPDYRRDWKTPAWEVARATSAAPTFFESHRYNLSYFLDGGVWANNPIMLAIVEAISSYDVSLDQIEVLSVGTGNPPPMLGQNLSRAGLLGWRDIISTAMYLTTDTALSQARLLLGFEKVTRIAPSEKGSAIELDDWSAAKELLPPEAEAELIEKSEQLKRFFVDKVQNRERHYSTTKEVVGLPDYTLQ